MKTLKNLTNRQTIALRLAELSPEDKARWGSMSVQQMVCHLDDSYKVPLGEKTASPATGFIQRTVLKWGALKVPIKWRRGYPTRPEIEQGKGGTAPADFRQDLASLLSTLSRFCDRLPNPCSTAAFWVKPLLWVLSRRLEVVAEEVCDDYVVHFGADRA